MGRRGNGAWTVFVIERKLLLVRRKQRLEENAKTTSDINLKVALLS